MGLDLAAPSRARRRLVWCSGSGSPTVILFNGLSGRTPHWAHELLAAAEVPGPYVLGGPSVGGTYALAYAMTFPADVAGVALIDSATPYQFDLPDYPGFYSMWKRASAVLPSLARLGVLRASSTAAERCPRKLSGRRAISRGSCGPTESSSPSFPRSSDRPRR